MNIFEHLSKFQSAHQNGGVFSHTYFKLIFDKLWNKVTVFAMAIEDAEHSDFALILA